MFGYLYMAVMKMMWLRNEETLKMLQKEWETYPDLYNVFGAMDEWDCVEDTQVGKYLNEVHSPTMQQLLEIAEFGVEHYREWLCDVLTNEEVIRREHTGYYMPHKWNPDRTTRLNYLTYLPGNALDVYPAVLLSGLEQWLCEHHSTMHPLFREITRTYILKMAQQHVALAIQFKNRNVLTEGAKWTTLKINPASLFPMEGGNWDWTCNTGKGRKKATSVVRFSFMPEDGPVNQALDSHLKTLSESIIDFMSRIAMYEKTHKSLGCVGRGPQVEYSPNNIIKGLYSLMADGYSFDDIERLFVK